jgi:enamine deaminase RidA (YjgF/YER057c/UK114 family)
MKLLKPLDLPTVAKPIASYLPYQQVGNLLTISGQLPMHEGKVAFTGKIGAERTVEEGAEAARLCLLNILAQIHQALQGDFSKLKTIVQLSGFVQATEDFTQHPEVINGASNMLIEYFGEVAKHSRIAVGVSSLPRNASVEIAAIVEVDV